MHRVPTVTPLVILGIGNPLLSDEGAGIHVLDVLRPAYAADSNVKLIDGGTLSFSLAPAIEEAGALIVVDAAQLKSPPGTVAVFEGEAMDRFLCSKRKQSVHEVGLADLMHIARLSGHWPQRRALVGIQPDKIDWGERPTPAVTAAIAQAAQCVRTLERRWRKEAGGGA